MNFAKFSVSRPVAVSMRIFALIILGWICLGRLPLDLLPKVSIPTVVVSTSWPNVAPEEMETQITRPIEQAVSSASNLYQVSSTSTQGNSSVRIQFNWGTDIGQAAVEVLQLVERAQSKLPVDPTLQTPVVFKFDPSTLPIQIYGVTGIDDPVKLRSTIDNEIGPILESANGVASATVTGGLQRAIIIDCDPDKLQARSITMNQVSQRLIQENANLPAGIARESKSEYTIRSVGYFASPDEALRIPIATVNGQLVRLGDVANVRDAYQEQRIYTRLNGKPAIGIAVVKQTDANTVATAQAVRDKVEEIKKIYPNLQFRLAYDQSGFIVNSVDDLKNTAIIGGGLAVIILMLFLRNFRSTLVVALSIPISIISTFALFYFAGFTLNTISLSGLALATGLIVDDAVVVLENIFRHIERDKKSVTDAAISGTMEIAAAVVSSTLTVIVVFFPLLLLKGQSGQTFTQFALVVIFSILVSLLDALTVVPMLASRLIHEDEVEEEAHPELREQHGKKVGPVTRVFDWFGGQFDALDRSYHKTLEWALRHRWQVVGGAFLICALSFFLVPMVGSELLPQTDSGDFTVNVKFPVGTSLDITNAAVQEIEKRLMANPDIETVFSAAGTTLSLRGSTTAQIGYVGSATVRMKADRKHSTADTIKKLQQTLQIPGANVFVTSYDLVTQILTGGASNMEVDVFSQNYNDAQDGAKQALAAMRNIPGLTSVDTISQDASPELRFKIDREKAQQFGVSFNDIATTVNTATGGLLSSYYQENGFQYPIYVQVPVEKRKTAEELKMLPIKTSGALTDSTGQPLPSKQILLGQVATTFTAVGPNEIDRLDRRRYIGISGRVFGRAESDVQSDIAKAMGQLKLPQGAYWDFGTNQKRRGQEFAGLGGAVFLAIALIYILLASQFESFIYPLVVLTSAPLCSVGVILALFLTGRAFGLTAFIGLLMLVGIVVKNGILLVDYTNQLRSRGMGRDEALLQACPTRLRPILMTTSAAVLGMLPLALQLGKGSETQSPLATAVVGGLTTSTMLTLLVVPVVYAIFDDLAKRFRRNKATIEIESAGGESAA